MRTEILRETMSAGTTDTVRVNQLLTPERIKLPLESESKESLLRELVVLATRSTGLDDQLEEIYRAVWKREKVLSTGIGDGVAVPHAKFEGLTSLLMAAGVSRPVDFDALDGAPVRLFFLLVGPERAAGAQVRALSRISRLMRDTSLRERLISAGDPASFLRALEEAERTV